MTDEREAGAVDTPTTVPPEVTSDPAEPSPASTKEIDLDPVYLNYLLSQHYQSSIANIEKEFGLDADDALFISDLDKMVLAGKLDLEAYLLALEDEFAEKLKDEQRDALYARLLAERFLPFGEMLKPTAEEVARLEGLKLPAVPHYQIYTKPLTYSGAATEVASMADFSLIGGPIRERLRETVLSKAKGVRVDSQAMEQMTRGLDFGGLGLDAPTADRALRAMNDILGRAKVVSEEEYANWLADEAMKKQQPEQQAKLAMSPDDEEIAMIQKNMPQPVVDTTSELAKAVIATLERLDGKPNDPYLLKRLGNVISSRLRDVRSVLEIRQLLSREVKVGGLGLEPGSGEAMAKKIEAAYQEFHAQITEEEKKKIERQIAEQTRKVGERRKREAEEHAKWYEEKIRARKVGEAEKSEVLEAMKKLAAQHPIDAKQSRAEQAKYGPLVSVPPAGQVCEINGKWQMLARRSIGEGGSNVKGEVKISKATAELAKQEKPQKPAVDGVVVAAPQLVGLAGELRSLSIAEFRRLSKNPQEAIKKIIQKVETLGQESYEKRLEGVQALRTSPFEQAYLSLVGESFRAAKPITTLAEEKRKAGQDTLLPDEIGAIVQLNSALHF